MKWLTLDRIKQQCRIEPDMNDEDELLELYGESAEEAILKLLDRTYDDLVEKYGKIPAPVVHTSLLVVSSAYKDREKDLVQSVYANPTFSFLLKPYMRLTTCSCNN